MAERITQLGGTARSARCRKSVSDRPSWSHIRVDIYQVSDHIHALIERYRGRAPTRSAPTSTKSTRRGDPDTADILTEVSRGIDKQLWFLEAHTQERVRPAAQLPDRAVSK